MAKYRPMNQIKPDKIGRFETGIDELDWLYGQTITKAGTQYGIPYGKISLWSGIAGIGKSRACIALARSIVGNRNTVTYFPLEQDASSFAADVQKDGKKMPAWFYVSEETSVKAQLEIIQETEPSLVIVDSINMLDDFKTGTVAHLKYIIDVYKEACKFSFKGVHKRYFSPHIIINSQLNKTGEPRGSSVLPHLVDIEFILTRKEDAKDNFFTVKVGKKHRYGRTGDDMQSLWYHYATHAQCHSINRLNDPMWSKHSSVKKTLAQNKLDQMELISELERGQEAFEQIIQQLIASGHPLVDKGQQSLQRYKNAVRLRDTNTAAKIMEEFDDEVGTYKQVPHTVINRVINLLNQRLRS